MKYSPYLSAPSLFGLQLLALLPPSKSFFLSTLVSRRTHHLCHSKIPTFDFVLAQVWNVGMTRSNSLFSSSMYNSNIPLKCTQLNDLRFKLTSCHFIFLDFGKVTSLAFSNVHPAALATHAFKDFPLVNRVLAVDSTLLHEPSHVDSMRRISLSIKKYLCHLLWFSLHEPA